MKTFRKITLLILLLVPSAMVFGQTIQKEGTYDISRKARRGTLAEVEYDGKKYTLYYISKSTEKKMKIQVYEFDLNFVFISERDEELEFEKARTKYVWFKKRFKREAYTITGISVERNFSGTLILKRKEITKNFDAGLFGYRTKVKVLEKLKPKTESGANYFYHSHYEDENTGNVHILVGEKSSKTDKTKNPYQHMHLIEFNQDLDVVHDMPITHNHPMAVVKQFVTDEIDLEEEGLEDGVRSFGDICLLLAPIKMKGMTEDPDFTNWKYMRIGTKNELVNNLNFKTKSAQWRVDEIIETDSEVYFYGPCAEGSEKYYDMYKTPISEKFREVQLMRIVNGDLDFVTLTNLDDFEAKLKTPPSQKRSPAYKGKKFMIKKFQIMNGELLIMGQNYTIVKDKESGLELKKFTDILSFQFDNKGALKAQYGIDLIENNKETLGLMNSQNLIQGKSPNSLYWIIQETDDVNNETGRMYVYPRIAKLDWENAKVNDFKLIGANEKGNRPEYFLDPTYPFLSTATDNSLVFFGATKRGKTIWFSRILLD